MAVDNISKFYDAFNAKYDNFQTEDEFRDFLKNANRENIDNLYSAFNEAYDNFGSADDMISYLGWGEPSRSTTETEQMEQPKRMVDQKAVAEGRSMFEATRASRQPDTSTMAQAPADTQQYMRENPVVSAPVQQGPTRDELVAALGNTQEEQAFISEYEQKWADYQKDTDNELSGPDVQAKKKWLDENNEKYRADKQKVEAIQGKINLIDKEEDLARISQKRNEVRTKYSPSEIVSRGLTPFGGSNTGKSKDAKDFADYSAANEIYGMAEQTLNQGSKYDPGYEGNWLDKAWTAAEQFASGAVNNIDSGSLTLGLSEGAALTRARSVGEKSNKIVNATIKDMGYSDSDVNSILSTIEKDGNDLVQLSEELEKESAELDIMKETLDGMRQSGASQSEYNALAKKYNQKINDLQSRVKNEYEPLAKEYEDESAKYETIMAAVDSALESGLSDGEKTLLDALEEFTDAKIKRAKDVSVASAAGAGAEQSAEFMLDFILTGGLTKAGAKAATKLTTKRMLKKFGKDALNQVIRPSLGARFVSDIGVAAGRTAMMFPRNLQAYGENLAEMVGKDNLGRYNFDRSHLNAALNTALSQYIEYWSEGFGEYFSAGERALFKNATKAAPHAAIGRTLNQYRGSIGKYLDYGKFDGMFNEMLEEGVGAVLNALNGFATYDKETKKSAVGDKDALRDFASGEQLATLALSFLPMSAISARTNLKAYNKMKERYNEGVAALDKFIKAGAISQEELDNIITGISEKTPVEIKDQIIELTDKARKSNGGHLPSNFVQNLMGYVEGSFAMNLNSEAWDDSAEKMSVISTFSQAYTEQNLNPYDLVQNEKNTRKAAEDAGFDENTLDSSAYILAMKATGMKEYNPEGASVLMDYANAKAAKEGQRAGYDNDTNRQFAAYEREVYDYLDNNGSVISAVLNGENVYVSSRDAKIGADGRLTTPTGIDGIVTYRTEDGVEGTVKASELAGVTQQGTEDFLFQKSDEFGAMRNALYDDAENTTSPTAKIEALGENVGNTVFVTGNGAYEPVVIQRLTNDGATVVISGDKEALKGIALAAGIQSPGGTNLELPVDSLWQMLAKDNDGSLSTEKPEGVVPEDVSAPGAAEEDMVTRAQSLIGSEQTIHWFGDENRDVFVTDINNGNVWFDYEDRDGNPSTSAFPISEFLNRLDFASGASAVTETTEEATPADESEPAPAEEVGGIPVDEKTGEPIYDAHGVTTLQAYEDIYGKLSEKNADAYVIEQSDAANKNLKKAQKLVLEGDSEKVEIDNWDKNPGEGLNAFLKRQEEAKAKVDEKIGNASAELPELQRKAAFWNELREVAEANIADRKREAERQAIIDKYGVDITKFDLTPQSAEEAVAEYLGNNEKLINMDDAKREVFGKVGRVPAELFRHGGNGGIITYDGGRTIQDVANDIVGEYETLALDQDDVRNIIIDALAGKTKTELRNLIFENRLASALAEREASEAPEAELEQQNGTSEEEAIPAEEAVEEAPEGTEVPEVEEPVAEPAEPEPATETAETQEADALRDAITNENTLTPADIVELWNNRSDTSDADRGKPGRKELISALYEANPELVQFRNEQDQINAISDVVAFALQYPELELSKIIIGKLASVPNEETAPVMQESIKPGDRLNDGTIFRSDDILLRDLAWRIDPWIIERLEGVGYQTAQQVLGSDLGSVALDTNLEMDELAEVYNILREELANKKNEAPAPILTESVAQNATESEQTPSESQEESVSSQQTEAQPVEEPATETVVETERELTEEEIRNSGYPDQDVIDSAVDYINGERGFAETLAYQQVKDYVRTNTATTEQAGETAGSTQLDGQSVQTSSTGAERSGGSTEQVDNGGNREGTSRGNGTPSSGVLSGKEGPANNGTKGQQAGANVNGSREPGRRSGTDESGLQLANDTGRPAGNERGAGEANQRGIEAGSTDIDALGGELDDLLKQFSDTKAYIAPIKPNLVESKYPYIAPAEPVSEKTDEGKLSSKQVKQPTASLSLEGLTPQQAALATKIIFTSAKLGYAYAKTEGLTTFNDFKRWFKSKYGDAVMKGLNYNESSLDAFIAAAWQAKLSIDGKRLTLAEHDAALHDEELLSQRDVPVSERIARQEAANKKGVQVIRGSRKNIAESVPILTPGQWDDLVAIERQFFDPTHNDYDHCYGKGMLVSNGTGTGKTFTGLGTIKRFVDEGRGRVLVVAPAAMKHEWSEKAKLLGIKMSELESKKDKGEGVVVTSYENFRDNTALYEDTFDLVVYDECQNIIENQKGEETMAFAAHRMIANKNVEEAQERLASATEPGRRRSALQNQLRSLETERKKPKPRKGQTKDDRIAEITLEQRELEAQIASLTAQVNLLKPGLRDEAEKAVKRTKVLFLSATPFNTISNLRYGAGFIFNYPKIFNSRQEEVEDENQKEQAFWTEWFRGDAPMEQLEVEFGDHLLDDLETNWFRSLENGYDYSREHPDVSGMVMAVRFNAAMRALFSNPKYNALKRFAGFLDNPLYNSLLYETMKASAMRDRIKGHLAAGRKVVIFHDRLHQTRSTAGNLPPVGPPLATVLDLALNAPAMGMQTPVNEIADFRREYADVLKWELGLDYRPVHEQIIDFFATDADRAKYEANRAEAEKKMAAWRKEVEEFARRNPDLTEEEFEEQMPKMPKGAALEAECVALYNGECTNKEKEQAKAEFNNDNSKKTIICVTTRSGGAGLSLHDTTGVHQRIMIQMALPISPIGFIQAEGRIFRWGNRSNAAFEYPRLGIDKEMEVFAMSFNAKAETVENIAHGFRGRGLKDSIMTGFYESSGNVPIDGEGVGGVERDRRGSTLQGMAKAKHDYGVAQRKGFKTGDVSIPEPVGYMMAALWGKAANGDTALIPFAGRGSIARYIPSGIQMTTMEQDVALRTDLQCTAGRPEMKIKDGLFGELNPINKADVILLDGNFDPLSVDSVGSMRKGFAHLSEGGRMIAVVPEGEDLKYALEDFEGLGGLVRMIIKVGPGTLDSNTDPMNIVIVDKVTRPELRSGAPKSSTLDLSSLNKEQLFDQIENVKVPERIIDKQAIKAKKVKAVLTELRKNKLIDSADLRREDDPKGAYINVNMTDRFAKGMNKSRYRFDSLRPGYSYWTGKYFNIEFPDTDYLSERSDAIIAYKWIKEQLALPDKEFRRNTDIAGDAKQEDVETLKDLYRSYLKLIRAMTNMTESQLMRIAQGLRPDISAADIDTLNGYPQLREKFEAANHEDEERQEMYDKVAGVAEKLGLDITVYSKDDGFAGGYVPSQNKLEINRIAWARMEDDSKATTLLHEFIHSVTSYALDSAENEVPMSDELYEAANFALSIFNQITKGDAADVAPMRGYSLENAHELMAEMANPKVREKLKNRRMWVVRSNDKRKAYGYEVPNAEQTTAWDILNEALNDILKYNDTNLYKRYTNKTNNYSWRIDESGKCHQVVEDANETEDNLLFREETDPDVLKQLEEGDKLKVYRAMQLIDGQLYPPMSAKVNGKMREPIALGKWEKAEENPSLADDKGYFILNKGNGTSLKAKYNPYIHTSRTPLNDQFTSAYARPNLVTVEVEIPESELTSGYKAEKAKDSVGEMTWHSGPVSGKLPEGKKRKVILSRWDKPVRILSDMETAERIAELLEGENIAIPYNVVTPGLRAELEKLGVKISDAPSGTVREREGSPIERKLEKAELDSTVQILDSMSKTLGTTINRVTSDEMPKGHKSAKGYFNPNTDELFICMDNVTDERDAIATVFHETVGHYGLRKLFGESFNDAMVRIYANLDSKGRAWVNAYIQRNGLRPGDNAIIRGMEEYMSTLAETGDFKNSVWQRIKEIFGKIVDKIFGTTGFVFTDRELNYILRASYEHLKDPNWLDTIPGQAKDILMKRELGINETDPNKPTDPDGPGTGILFRDGDTANADYNAAMDLAGNKIITENQNADLPVKIGMERVMKEVGKKSISEDEDYLVRHNIASSRAESEAHNFELFKFEPLLEQVRSIRDMLIPGKSSKNARQDAYEKVLDYMYAESGLERNNFKNDEIEQAKQDALVGVTEPEDIKKITDRYDAMKKDWSGLTSLFGLDPSQWQLAEMRAEALIGSFRNTVGDDAVNELWNRVRACTDYNLEHAYKYGLLTRDEYERLHGTDSQPRMWEYYLPLRGFDENTAEDEYSYANFTNPSPNSVVVKKMNGRWTKASNPLANILNIAETEIVQGQDNWAKQALYRFTLDAGENSLLSIREPWYVKDPATGKWSLAEPYQNESIDDFEKRMEAYRSMQTPLAKKGRRGLRLDSIMANKAHQNEHLIRLKVGGLDKMIWVNGNPALAKAVSGIGRAQNMQLIRRASRALSNLFTTYSLDFTAKNLIRDTVYSRIALLVKEDRPYRRQFRKNWYSNLGYGAFAFPMIRLAAQWESGKLQQKANPTEKEQMFMDFMRDGGQTGYTIINSVNEIKRSLEKSMALAGEKSRSVAVPILGHYAKAVKTLNEAFELLTRFTAYQTSRDMGRSGQRSASDAKEISVNFNRRGAQSGEGIWGNIAAYLGATHYFYNAGVQGFDNFLNLFKVSPKKMSAITTGFIMMGALTPLINAALAGLVAGMGDGSGDDDWYWNLPEWVRRNNIVIGTGKWYMAIPLPVEFRAPYGIGDIAGMNFMYRKQPNRSFGQVSGDILSTAAGILPVNPVEGYTGNGNLGDAALRAVAPDATMFFVDWATNRDYTGRPLWKENPFSNTVPMSQGAYASTPKGIVAACQFLAENTNGKVDIAPGLIRDFMNNYGGGFYRAAEDVSKIMFTDSERPFRYDNIPFFSGFTGHIDEDRSNSFANNALYEYKNLSEGVVKSLNAVLNTDEVTAAIAYDNPETLYNMASGVIQTAKVKRILSSPDYELGKIYREGMNNKYKMKQHLSGAKAGQWYKSRKEVERKGVDALKQDWRELREQWAAMPEKTEEEKSAKAMAYKDVTNAWHTYYDAQANLVDLLMDYEYNHPGPSLTNKAYEAAKDIIE